MLKAILLDYYGVLRPDTYELWLSSHGLERTGFYATIAQRYDTGAIDRSSFFEALSLKSGVEKQSVETFFNTLPVIEQSTIELLKRVHSQFLTAVISNGSLHTRHQLKEDGLLDYFDVVMISAECGYSKPSPEIFTMTLRQLGIKQTEAALIDDRIENVHAAQVLGIRGLHLVSIDQLEVVLDALNLDDIAAFRK